MPVQPPTFRPSYVPAPKERARQYDQERGSSRQRGYDGKWEKARKAYLNEHPLCVHCEREDELTIATVVDHITPHRGDMVLFWDQANWQSLCEMHHNRKTQTEGARPYR